MTRRDTKLERAVESRVCERAFLELGVRNIKINTATEAGWPDRMFLIPGGRPLFIEFKRMGESLRSKQVYIHGILEGLDYDVETHDDVDAAMWAIARRVP